MAAPDPDIADVVVSDKEIAHRLEVEISTIRTHLNHIFDKLGVRRRSGVASLFAMHH